MASSMLPGFIQGYSPNTIQVTMLLVVLYCIYAVCTSIYNGLFHPLAHFPGPLSHRVSNIPRTVYLVSGRLAFHVSNLHAKYGPVVRISPNELAFCEPQAWQDIYGRRQPGREEFSKYLGFYRPVERKGPASIISASRHDHTLIRRQLSPGFSDRSLRSQEPIIGVYVDLLVQRLREHGGAGDGTAALNMREWLNWTTFDIIGDLGFGSPFGCLESSDYHPWVLTMARNIKISTYMQALGLWKSRSEQKKRVSETLVRRIELKTDRPDLIQGLLRKQDDLTFEQISVTASTLIFAGSETTATLLSGALFLLDRNRDKLAILTKEIRTTFYKDNPWEFHPERFLPHEGDSRYRNDVLDAMQPFSTGPRNCIGKNLAYAEMRFILAKIIFNFDLRLADDSEDWLEKQRVYFLWDKPALNVHLTPVTR
ncbi:hypothetical protein PG989_005352 [Apiospora arundinis]